MGRTKKQGIFKRRQNLRAIILCAGGVAVNLFMGYLVSLFALPLYLDTVGTISVAIMGGYFPGIVVGFFTNVIKSFYEPSALYYGIFNVLVAVLAAFLADHGWHKKIFGRYGMMIIFAVICGGIGSIIPWFMEDLPFTGQSLSIAIYNRGYFGSGVSHVIASIIMDLPDKVISVLFAMWIIHLIPEKNYEFFKFKSWMQMPVTEDKDKDTVKNKVRVMSLQTKILLVLGSSLLIVSAAAMGIGVTVYRKNVIKQHSRIAQGTAKIAAATLDGDKIEEYVESKGTAEGYKETEKMLYEILNSSTDISYLYVYKLEDYGCRVVFDISSEGFVSDRIGELVYYDENFADAVNKFIKGEEADTVVTKNKNGYLLTAFQPVYNSKGECVCYVGADVDMNLLVAMRRNFLMETASVFLSFFFLMCAFVIWLVEYHIIFPINSIAKSMDKLSNVSDSQEIMDEDVRLFRSLGIHTGDEVENLYKSACRMTRNQAEQMRRIRQFSEFTAKMQDGLIVTMADLVESRDSDTGAHVQKTAAYVKIIVEGLKKKGYYAEKITPQFMSDVVRSAPLHDVGKINIPDRILNKPGRLTDEEYEIMKTHTTAGKKIMENAISTVEGESYLKEARNMAAYHHERWDGKGYPEGLHGEVIPLAARIMAVADVFDALTSPRVYKPAFPLEKALEILEEGKGTQFDPKCVEVFFDELPEVRYILKKYNPDS